MEFQTDYPWSNVEGLDTDGLSIQTAFDNLLNNTMTTAERHELLTDLYRDNTVSTAAYRSLPILLRESFLPPRIDWEFAYCAALILIRFESLGCPPVPPELLEFCGKEARQVAFRKLLKYGSMAELNSREASWTLEMVQALVSDTSSDSKIGIEEEKWYAFISKIAREIKQ